MSFDPQTLVGQAVGEFKLVAFLSRAGAILRYRAEHQRLRRVATCHVLSKEETAQHGASFLDAARRLSQIRQRNLLDIFDSGTIEGSPYVVSEELQGEPLPAWIARHRWSASRLHTIAQQLGAALLALDGAGVPLRHVAPDGILVRRSGGTLHVKLVDCHESWHPLRASSSAVPQTPIFAAAELLFGLSQARPFSRPLPEPSALNRPILDGDIALAGLPAELDQVLRRGLGTLQPPFSTLADFLGSALAAIPRHEPLQITHWMDLLRQRQTWLFITPILLLALLPLWLLLRRPPAPPPVIDKTYTVRELHDLARATLEAGLRSSLPAVREQALSGLLRSSDISWRAQVEPLLDDPALAVQVRAAEVLGSLGSRKALPLLQAHLSADHDPLLRAVTAQSLHKLGGQLNRSTLESLIQSDTLRARRIAVQLLFEQGDAQAAKLVTDLQGQGGDESIELQLWAARRGDETALAQVRAALPKTPPLDVKQLPIAEFLLRQEVPAAKALLSATVKVQGPAQTKAAQILCATDEPAAQALLRDVLGDAARALPERQIAALGLAQCGERADWQLLARIIVDPKTNDRLKQSCAGALLRLTSQDPELLSQHGMAWAKQALDDESWSVRESAVALLGENDESEPVARSSPRRADAAPAAPSQVVELIDRAMEDAALPVRLTAMRSAVKVAKKTKEQSDQERLKQSLRKRAQTGLPEEQIVAAASLLRMGDASYRDTLHSGLKSSDVAVRRRAISEADADPKIPSKLLAPLTTDADFAVRSGAAALLVAQGQKKPALIQILRESVQHGGSEGVRAFALLQKQGEITPQSESKAPDLDTLLASSDVLQRLMAIDTLQKLPTEEAAPLLLKATRDPDATVRFRLVDVVAHHCQTKSPAQRLAFPALRALAEDNDVAVRARAFGLLSQLQSSLGREQTDPQEAPKEDDSAKDATTSEPTTLEAQPTLSPELARKSQVVEQQFASGSALFKQGNYRAAQKALEKTNQLCATFRGTVPKCAQINSNLSYQLGVVYENLGQLASAMTEYQKVLQGTSGGKIGKRPAARAGLALHDAAQQGSERLRSKLGRLVLYKTLAGRCQKVEVFMPPGKHQVNVGAGQRKPVELDAGETVELRTCR